MYSSDLFALFQHDFDIIRNTPPWFVSVSNKPCYRRVDYQGRSVSIGGRKRFLPGK